MLEFIRLLNSGIRGFFQEVIVIATSQQRLKQLISEPLYYNAVYLMVSSAFGALCGLVFWVIAARFYPAETVGMATAVISSMGLLASFSNLGLGYGLVRFLPEPDRNANNLLNSSFTVSILAALVAAIIFLSGLGVWSPKIVFLRQDPLLISAFIVFTITFTLKAVVGNAIVAKRRTSFLLLGEVIFNVVRLPLVIIMAGVFHAFGIFGSWGISLWVSLMFHILLFLPRLQSGYHPRLTIDRGLGEVIRYSLANYFSDLLRSAPGLVLPIMIINLAGAEYAAYFYVAWMIGGTIASIAESASVSLFAEGSHSKAGLGLNTGRSLKLVFLILVPAVILVLVFADKLLLIFGGSYSESSATLLRILTISAFPSAINTVYLYVKRVEKNVKILIVVTAFIALTTLALTYVLLPKMGIAGAGIAWLASNGIVAVIIAVGFVKRRLSRQREV